MASALDAWRAFVSGGSVPPGSVSSVIVDSWERSRRAGVPHDPADVRFVTVSSDELARRSVANAELIDVARPHLKWISDWIGAVPHAVYLVDADGIVLASHGTDAAMLNAWGLVPGHDWSESAMGTNGAGTALVADRPVAVVGAEHYAKPWSGAT